MSKKKLLVMILALGTILAFGAVMATATSVTNNNAPEASTTANATNLPVMDFTVTDGGDTIINNDDGSISTAVGYMALTLTANYGYVDIDTSGTYNAGDEVVYDTDSDDKYSAQADYVLDTDSTGTTTDVGAGAFDTDPGNGYTDVVLVPSPAVHTTINDDAALYYYDHNNSGTYDSYEDIILEPNPGLTQYLKADIGTGDDDDDGTPNDDKVISLGAGGNQEVADGDTLTRFTAADNVKFVDGIDGANDGYYNYGGAVGDSEDIFIDYHNGGTATTVADTVINEGNTSPKAVDASDGDALTSMSGFVAFSSDASISDGDEIGIDADSNSIYRDQLTGISVHNTGTAEEGTDIDNTSVTLYVDDGDGVFEPATDPSHVMSDYTHPGTEYWEKTGLTISIPAAGQRFFVALDTTATARHLKTIQMEIPALSDFGTAGVPDFDATYKDQGLFFKSTHDTGNIANAYVQTIQLVHNVDLNIYYHTILLAVGSVTTNDTIEVPPGTYAPTDKIRITVKGVTLKSTGGAAVTKIDASGCAGNTVELAADNVTFEGFTIADSNYNGIAIYTFKGITVKNNIITNAPASGITMAYAGAAPTLIVESATVSGNVLTDCVTGIDFGGCTKNCMISNNTITGCDATGRGIAFNGGTAADKTKGNTITGNTITGNACMGIYVKQDIAPGYFEDNLIEGNTISGNDKDGIEIEAGLTITNLAITGNDIHGNADDGIEIGSWGSTNTINGGNSIFGNAGGAPRAQYGIENTSGTTADATNNWWGYASGPYHGTTNPGGQGNAVTDDVDFQPFWVSPTGGSTTADTWGVFRNGAWYLDITGDYDAADTYETFNFDPSSDGVPLVGDWSATDTDTWGVWRAGAWYLDITGDGDAGDPGETFNFGNATDTPLVGDWNGDGTDTWGVFRDGAWFLDHNGDGTADEAFYFGNATDTPLVGDWNGDDTDTWGVFRDGAWFLDKNGDYDAADVGEAFYFGNATDTPLVGNWSGDDTDDTCGVWRAGAWFLDKNGDNDAADTGEAFYFGLSTDTPLVGNWGSGSAAPQAPQAASAAGWYAMCFPNPASTGDAVTFRMMGAGVNAVQVSIYDLGGGLVYQSNFETGRSLTWDLYSEGAPVANGIYLYSMIAKANGELIETEIGKLLILR